MNKTIDELVNRFLRWKLPEDFSPDGGITYNKIQYPPHTTYTYIPVGTNLFTADQAKAMFEYLLSEPQPILSQRKPTISKMETTDPVGYAVWNEVENEWDLDSSIKNHHDMGHVDNSKILPVYLAKQETSQGEPVGYLRFISNTNVKFIHNLVLKGASPIITPYTDIPVYLAPQAELFGKVEQLKLEKAELIEYVRKLHETLASINCKLAIPQPKFMDNE